MYYLSLLACLGVFILLAGAVKTFDLGGTLSALIIVPATLLTVCGLAWCAAKDSAAEARRLSAHEQN